MHFKPEHFAYYSIYALLSQNTLLHSSASKFKHEDRKYNVFCFQEPQRPWTDHQWGLCIFDDVIEYTGPLALR